MSKIQKRGINKIVDSPLLTTAKAAALQAIPF
jgi:hypothetical protein